MTPTELINQIALAMYKPPLAFKGDDEKRAITELGVVLLLLDYDAEVQSGGILGFLENSSGLFLEPTIRAFEKIGANQSAQVLSDIRDVMARHGTSTQKLRADHSGAVEFTITTFAALHGEQSLAMAREVEEIFKRPPHSVHENSYQLLDGYVAANFNAIVAQLEKCVS